MFHGCSSLSSVSFISNWETSKVIDMSYMFFGCNSLTFIDDISKWNIDGVNDISLIFYGCPLLKNSEKILNIFFQKNNALKVKEEKMRKILEEEEQRKRLEEERQRKLLEEQRKRLEEERQRKLLERKRLEEEKQRKKQKEIIIKKQMEFKRNKINNNEKIKGVLEDMCILGSIMKKEIIEEKKNKPEKFIPIKEATKKENEGKNIFCLGILAQTLENIGVTTVIEKNEFNDKESQNTSNTVLQFIMNGMIEKKKYDFHFDLGEERNNELLNNLDEQQKFNDKLRKKLSIEYNIPEDKIIITNPQKGSYSVQVIFESEEFNKKNFDINVFKNKCTDDEFIELKNLKEINTKLIMEGCKLTEKMLDSRGNRESGFEEGGKRGGFDYIPPLGWKGFGLKVLDEYDNRNNDWLACNGNKNEWAVAYKGIGTKLGFKVEDAARLIYVGEKFKVGKGQQYKFDKNINKRYKFVPGEDEINHKDLVGIGVYCSPNPKVMEEYARYAEKKANINGKEYLMGFMMRVKPEKIRISETKPDYWVLNGTTKEMRPYRLMIKEV